MASDLTFLKDILNFDSISFTYSLKDSTEIQRYTIKYSSNLEEKTSSYTVRYVTNYPLWYTDLYNIRYSSIYGDAKQIYRVRYISGRSLSDITERHYVRYTSNFSETNTKTYSIRYSTTGSRVDTHRVRYRLKYTSASALDMAVTYRIKYSSSSFYDNQKKYTINYTTTGAEEILVRALLLRNNETTDAVFELRSVADKSLDSYLYVLSNMPKYQTVEYGIGESLPYLQFLNPGDVPSDLFDLDGSDTYKVKGYLVLKDIEDLNGLSLDIYDIEEGYKKINKSKTYFFGVSSEDYLETLLSLGGQTYYYINKTSDLYVTQNLNYCSAITTPTFRFGIDCCFSRKINKTNYSYCSPF